MNDPKMPYFAELIFANVRNLVKIEIRETPNLVLEYLQTLRRDEILFICKAKWKSEKSIFTGGWKSGKFCGWPIFIHFYSLNDKTSKKILQSIDYVI